MASHEEVVWIDEYGSYWYPVYNIIKKVTGFTVPFLDFLSPVLLLFPLIPFSKDTPPVTANSQENVCDFCGEHTESYITVSLDTEVCEIGDAELESKILDIENKLKTITTDLIVSLNNRENLRLEIDHLQNQIMPVNELLLVSPKLEIPEVVPVLDKPIVRESAQFMNSIQREEIEGSNEVEQPTNDEEEKKEILLIMDEEDEDHMEFDKRH